MDKLNHFESTLAQILEPADLEFIQKVKIGIGGAGGLGSNVAAFLVRCGFLDFVIADKDKVEYSNLNRQFYFYDQVGVPKVEALKENLTRINPRVSIHIIQDTITNENIQSIYGDCTVLIEAFDKVDSKKMFVDSFKEKSNLLVAASGIAGWGNSDDIHTRKILENFYIVGDFQSAVSKTKPAISPRVTLAAAKQADIVLNYIIEKSRFCK